MKRSNAFRLFIAVIFVLPLCSTAFAQSISGVVRDQLSMTVLPGIDIDVFEISNPSVNLGGGLTDGSGLYTVALPGSGTYIIRADAAPTDGVADEYYSNALLKSQSTHIAVGATQSVTGVNFDLPRGVFLSGRVTSATTGLGIDLVDLDIYHTTGEFMGSYAAKTLADGSYMFGALPPGTYYIAADPNPLLGQLYQRTFFGGSHDILTAQPIVVGSTNVLNLNILLVSGGTIAGIVTDSSTGLPLAGIDIDLYDSLGGRVTTNAVTDLTGTYEIGPVPTGNYIVKVDPTILQGYALSYYPTGLTTSAAALVPVVAGQITIGVNVALSLGGSLSGIVTDGAAAPLVGIDFDIFDSLGGRVDLTAKTDASGVFLLGPMPTGNYIVRADPTVLQDFTRTYFINSLAKNMADLVSVSGGFETIGVDFTLMRAGSISGVIRRASDGVLLSGVDLDCYDALGNRIDFTAKSDINGAYTINKLPPGTYLLRADPLITTGLAPQLYLNQIDVNFGTPIVVLPNTDVVGIDFSLAAAASISGTITNQSGSPVAGIDLDLIDATTGVRLRSSALSDVTGFYQFTGLTPGTYKVRVDPSVSQPYALQYYTGKLTKLTANTVSTSSSVPTININFILQPGTSISGKITDALTGLPVQGVDIDALLGGTLVALDQSDKTAVDGTYILHGLPFASLLVSADPVLGQFYRTTYYQASATPANATPVVLASNTAVAGIDIAVQPASAKLRDEFHTLDVNGNNLLTYAESLVGLPKLSSTEFNQIDTNHDGSLTLAEILSSSNSSGSNTVVWVDRSHSGNELGTLSDPFNTVEEGAAFVALGGDLRIIQGAYPEPTIINHSMIIHSSNGPVTIGSP